MPAVCLGIDHLIIWGEGGGEGGGAGFFFKK